jgi:hypothetical protein
MRGAAATPALIKLNDSVAGGVKPLALSCREPRTWTTMDYERWLTRRIAAQFPVDEITVTRGQGTLLVWVYRWIARHGWILHAGDYRPSVYTRGFLKITFLRWYPIRRSQNGIDKGLSIQVSSVATTAPRSRPQSSAVVTSLVAMPRCR